MKPVLFILALLFTAYGNSLYGQQPDFSGTYKYELKDTPYGNFAGQITLQKQNESYKGEIVNDKGVKFTANVVRLNGNRIVIATNIEYSDAMLSGYFQGDSLIAKIEVKGDKFLYKFNAKKVNQ